MDRPLFRMRHAAPTARRTGVWLCATAAFALAGPAAGQVTTIPDEVRCRSCRISLERVAVVGSSSGADLFTTSAGVRMDSAGNILLLDRVSYPGQMLYRPAGDTSWVFMGRQGEGPGEFVLPGIMWFSADGLHVSDLRTGRETVFDRDGRLLATHRLPAPPTAVIDVGDGTWVHVASIRTRASAGLPLHHLDAERGLIRSFGADTALLLPGGAGVLARRVAARAADGAIWTARISSYRIEKWSVDGRKLHTIVRDADWFRPWVSREASHLVERPEPSIVSIDEDAEGRLWVVMYVADRDWERQVDPDYHGPVPPGMRTRSLDTLVEVLDPVAGTVIARARTDNILMPAGAPLLLGRRAEAADGSLRFLIQRMVLTCNPDTGGDSCDGFIPRSRQSSHYQ